MIINKLFFPSDYKFIEYDDQLWLKEAFKDYLNYDFESRIVNAAYLADDFLQSN